MNAGLFTCHHNCRGYAMLIVAGQEEMAKGFKEKFKEVWNRPLMQFKRTLEYVCRHGRNSKELGKLFEAKEKKELLALQEGLNIVLEGGAVQGQRFEDLKKTIPQIWGIKHLKRLKFFIREDVDILAMGDSLEALQRLKEWFSVELEKLEVKPKAYLKLMSELEKAIEMTPLSLLKKKLGKVNKIDSDEMAAKYSKEELKELKERFVTRLREKEIEDGDFPRLMIKLNSAILNAPVVQLKNKLRDVDNLSPEEVVKQYSLEDLEKLQKALAQGLDDLTFQRDEFQGLQEKIAEGVEDLRTMRFERKLEKALSRPVEEKRDVPTKKLKISEVVRDLKQELETEGWLKKELTQGIRWLKRKLASVGKLKTPEKIIVDSGLSLEELETLNERYGEAMKQGTIGADAFNVARQLNTAIKILKEQESYTKGVKEDTDRSVRELKEKVGHIEPGEKEKLTEEVKGILEGLLGPE